MRSVWPIDGPSEVWSAFRRHAQVRIDAQREEVLAIVEGSRELRVGATPEVQVAEQLADGRWRGCGRVGRPSATISRSRHGAARWA